MPPKNKSPNKKTKATILIDGLTKEEMSKEQMVEHINRLREELDREREERNFFQLERDQIQTFREVTERHVKEVTAQIQNLEHEVEEGERRYEMEVKVYKQKMKHLLCEHQNMMCELRAEASTSTEALKKDQLKLEKELHRRMMDVRARVQEVDIEERVKDTDLRNNAELSETRRQWEKQLTELQAEYEQKLELMREDVTNMMKSEVSETDDLLNGLSAALVNHHQQMLSDALTLLTQELEQHLNTNECLKKHVEELKLRKKQKEKELATLQPDNKRLHELLGGVQQEVDAVQRRMKQPAQRRDPKEKAQQRKLKDLKHNCELLKQKLSKLQVERDGLYESLTQTVSPVPSDAQSSLQEEKLHELVRTLERTQAQVQSVLANTNVDRTALRGLTRRIQDEIDSRNQSIKNLQSDRAKISQAEQEVLLYYEARKRPLDVPV